MDSEDSQEVYDNAIENVKTGGVLYITKPLSGEINLRGNKDISEIHFASGNIDRIYNAPKSLKKLVINNNQLVEFPSLEFSNLVHLEAQNNQLSKLDLQPLSNIAYINVSNNKCTVIENVPESLRELYANNNQLITLNLNGAHITRVDCIGNQSLNKIMGAQNIGTINKDSNTQIVSGSKNTGELKYDVKEAINEYYKLKSQYELEIRNNKKSRKNNVIKCINCKKPGGTKFLKRNVKDELGYLRAICGNTTQPCQLNIEILASLNNLAQASDSNIKEFNTLTKQSVVQLKMDTIFGYMTEEESVKKFEELKRYLNYETYINTMNDEKYSYFEIVNDLDKQRVINAKMQGIHQELGEIRTLMNEYNKTKRDQLLKDITAKHVAINNQMQIIRGLKYPVNEVIQENELNVLKQYPYSFDLYNEDMDKLKVVKFTR